ncbi:10232_t:CDS:2 [Acaulospora colombiana]|uniref:10232_t:CDS:1 n=1 Tax=Acaulospora colombiana TaxID=27376 RepID=A0ACA9NIZ2_9GLOM|nr:10232_t:CDS:2 [Acaulospora colombiana]
MEHSLPIENEDETQPQAPTDDDASEKPSTENISSNDAKTGATPKSRVSILSPSRLSTMFDPTIISTWITGAGIDQQTKTQKRTTRVLDNTLKVGLESIRLSTGPDFSLFIENEELDKAFENLLDEMNIHGHHRNKMLEMSEDHKRTLIIQNKQAHASRQSQQQDKMANGEEEKSQQDFGQKDTAEYNGDTNHEDSLPSRDISTRVSESSIDNVIENDVEQRVEQPLISAILNSETVLMSQLEERPNSSNAGGFFSSWIPAFGFSTSSAKLQDTPEFYVEKLAQRYYHL